jgi:hypothetical protein
VARPAGGTAGVVAGSRPCRAGVDEDLEAVAFGIGETMAAVQADTAKGVTDRFRSLPMAPSAVVVGRCLANMVYSAAGLALLVACGLAVGWRWHGTVAEALAAFGLLLIAPELMPDWLGTVAEWNPISATITATRELFGNPGTGASGWIAENAMLMAVVWPVLITAATLPLAVRAFQRLSR